MAKNPLENITVVSFESRLAKETAGLIGKYGGRSISAPSMQEVPLDRHDHVFSFGRRLFKGEVDVLILLTGVGTRMLVEALELEHDRDAIVDRLRETILLARGPKPVRALRSFGLRADLKVPEPNTWKEILDVVDEAPDLQPPAGKRIVVQEYGMPNPELVEGLRTRGALVETVAIYRWELPDDLGPLRSGMRAIIDGKAQVAMFTSRTQADHLMQVASREDAADALKRALADVCVASIGPVCTAGLRSHGIEPDLEPEHPKLGALVRDVAARFEKTGT